jgi:CRISPR-associated endonuclease/helicase Cas3
MSLPKPEQFEEFYCAATLAIAELELSERRMKEPAFVPEKPAEAKEPFPWQKRLAKRVTEGNWPRAIALPTAAGKTGCIDIAVFALACRAKEATRRIFFVVDRRIVVDQAHDHAKTLAKVLDRSKDGLLRECADVLRDLSEPGWLQLSAGDRQRILERRWAIQDEKDEAKRWKLLRAMKADEREWFQVSPLAVYALRGGMYRETAWARSPIQPTIIASTVDQVGSRLLFRGYGVSDSMKPIHAALVGNDSLILLDEAHCARPFDQSMQAIEKYRNWGEGTKSPFRFVSMTATPTGSGTIEQDEEEDRRHPVLGERINASKPATLVVAEKAKGSKGPAELVKLLEGHAKELAKKFACVGIIVNRVATARELKAKLAEDFGEGVVLLTGRMRPLDRDRVFNEKLRPLLSNAEGPLPKFVIGTQCLECGADFDFHALVTECASLDALRQRFGRLNRVAKRPSAKAVVIIRADQTEDTSDDPVYGESLANTWKWLKSKASDDVFDFGVSAVRATIEDEDISSLNAPAGNAPVLFPAHLDCWVQTNPVPTPDPDPALFLHGPAKTGQPDVQLVFRDDLGADEKQWADIVSLCPPSSSEAVPVPIGLFKKWLAAEAIDDQSSDVEGEANTADEEEPITRSALRWRGPEKSRVVAKPDEITPNDVYVVPSSAEGKESLGDFPFGLIDYAQEAFQRSRDKALLRLPDLIIPEGTGRAEAARLVDEALEAIEDKLTDNSPDWLRRALESLKTPNSRDVDLHPLGGFVVTGKHRLRQFDPTYLDDSEPGESFRGRSVSLEDHSRGVAQYARRFADGCGLDVDLYYQAGLWHDLGKLDPRFQAMLKQSSPRTAVGEPLAKSARSPRTKEERKQAREVHRYPSGARHELLSAALVSTKTDDDLLLHVITTHHGSARPFAAPVDENEAAKKPFKAKLFEQTFQLDTTKQEIAAWNAELSERFWRNVRRYGWWGSAYRETIFRLADHAQSSEEQEPDWKPGTANISIPVLSAKVGRMALHPLALTGLDGSNPLAFLAAVGTLRLADELFPGTALRWEVAGGWQPVLELPARLSEEEFLGRLHARVHRVVDANASSIADDRHKAYRARKKEVENAMKSIKERKLRGKERDEAIAADVAPLQALESAARREWLQALESAVPAPFLSLGKSIAVSAEEFAAFASRTAERLHQLGPCGRPDADFASSFGCEACIDRNGRVIPTEFQLITGSGHQFFLETFATLLESVTSEQLRRSLFGPWNYSDPRLSFRWDPLDDRRYAVSWEDPSSTEVRTEHGANLLAAFALPLFPVAPERRRAKTTGFNTRFDGPQFRWPLWEAAHRSDVIRSLFQLTYLHDSTTADWQREQFGVRVAFQVRKLEVGKPPLSKLNLSPAFTV